MENSDKYSPLIIIDVITIMLLYYEENNIFFMHYKI